MRKVYKTGVVNIICIIYAVCAVFRGIEYMVIRTDKSILGEAFIHKLIGILILAIALKVLYVGWKEIGFDIKHAGKYLGYGIGFSTLFVKRIPQVIPVVLKGF